MARIENKIQPKFRLTLKFQIMLTLNPIRRLLRLARNVESKEKMSEKH